MIIIITVCHNNTFLSIDDMLLFGTIKSSKNLRLSKNFHVETGGMSSTPVPVGFFFFFFLFSRPNVALTDLIFVFISDSKEIEFSVCLYCLQYVD